MVKLFLYIILRFGFPPKLNIKEKLCQETQSKKTTKTKIVQKRVWLKTPLKLVVTKGDNKRSKSTNKLGEPLIKAVVIAIFSNWVHMNKSNFSVGAAAQLDDGPSCK